MPRRVAVLLAAATALLSIATPGSASAVAVVPVGAQAFRDSVGVNVHASYFDTAYGDWPRIVAALGDLGVTHVRDGVYGNPAAQWRDWNTRYFGAVELAASSGIRFDFLAGRPGYQGGTLDQLIGVLRGRLRNAVDALEAPNEFDGSGWPGWPSALARYDRDLYAKVKADSSLRSLPVIGPSFLSGADSAQRLGDQQSSLNVGNIHPYTGGQSPSPGQVAAQLALAGIVAGHKPVWATEAGFHNALEATVEQPPVSEAAGAVYLLRTLLEHFKNGITRTYAYELIDEKPNPAATDPEQHFGLLRNDFSPKPAFSALKNLLALVGHASGRTALAPLQLGVSGPAGVRQLVLEKPDGTYLVALWRPANVWDTARRQPLHVNAQPVTLSLPTNANAQIADPINTALGTPLALDHGHAQIQLGADPLILHITTPPPTGPAAHNAI